MLGFGPISQFAISQVSQSPNIPLGDVYGTGYVGTFSITAGTTINITGVNGTGAVGSFSIEADASINLSGVAGTGAVNSVIPVGPLPPFLGSLLGFGPISSGAISQVQQAVVNNNVALTGIATTGINTPFAFVEIDGPLTAVYGTGYAGTFTAGVSATLTGAAGTGAVGNFTPTNPVNNVLLTGVAATGSFGTFSFEIDFTLVGVEGTTVCGSFFPGIGHNQAITGVAGTGAVNTFSIEGDANLSLAGVAATGAVNTVSVGIGRNQPLTDVYGTGYAGTLTPNIQPSLAAAAATGVAGQFYSEIDFTLTGVAGTGVPGTIVALPGKLIPLVGMAATGAFNSFTDFQSLALTATPATAAIGSFAFRGDVSPSLISTAAIAAYGTLSVSSVPEAYFPSWVSISRPTIATDGLYTDAPGSSYNIYQPNVAIVTSLGMWVFGQFTNFLTYTDAPVTQTITLATGTYTLWAIGTGTVVVSAGSGTATGLGTHTPGTPLTFTVTVSGTFVFTVSGSINRFQCSDTPIAMPYMPSLALATPHAADVPYSLLAGPLEMDAWIVETNGLQPATVSSVLGINSDAGLGETPGNSLRTNYGGTQFTSNTATWSGIVRSGITFDVSPTVSIDLNGGPLATAANPQVLVSSLYFGVTNSGGTRPINGFIRKIAGYPNLPAVQLQAKTTPNAPLWG